MDKKKIAEHLLVLGKMDAAKKVLENDNFNLSSLRMLSWLYRSHDAYDLEKRIVDVALKIDHTDLYFQKRNIFHKGQHWQKLDLYKSLDGVEDIAGIDTQGIQEKEKNWFSYYQEDKINILFTMALPSALQSHLNLIEALQNNPIFSLAYTFPEWKESTVFINISKYDSLNPKITEKELHMLIPFSIYKPDIVFIGSQWLNHSLMDLLSQPRFQSIKKCLIPYCVSLLDGPRDICQSSYKLVTRVYVPNQLSYLRFKKHHPDFISNFLVTGYPKFTRLQEKEKQERKNLNTILWTPHHSMEYLFNFGVFHKMFHIMLGIAKKSPHFHFVFKPHPKLEMVILRHLNNNHEINIEKYYQFVKDWQDLPNCSIYDAQDEDYRDLFDTSSLLITDGISFLGEYPLLTDNPMIFLDSGKHDPFNSLGELAIQCAYQVSDFSELEKTIDLAFSDRENENFKKARIRLREAMLDRPDKTTSPSAQIINDILSWDWSSKGW